MITFNNKLELRYYFSDRSNYVDAQIRHRCEKEVLYMLRALADMLDVKMTIYNEAYPQGEGYRDIWAVAGADSRLISVVLNLFMQIWVRPSLMIGGQPMDRSEQDEARMQAYVSRLRQGLKKKDSGVIVTTELVALLSSSPRICKCKSNFYEALRGYPKVVRFTLREVNGNNRIRSGLLEVKRERFDAYILRSDELPALKDSQATIELISPVLRNARYRWKGIYNKGGATIDFYMNDEEFKRDMFDEKITFKSGMCIDCILEIQRKINEMGEVVNVSYTVETVLRTRFDQMEIVTPQGKRQLRKMEAERQQLTFDFFS